MKKKEALKWVKKRLGGMFLHIKTGTILRDTDGLKWNVGKHKNHGGVFVAFGCYVVWSETRGWFAEPCK